MTLGKVPSLCCFLIYKTGKIIVPASELIVRITGVNTRKGLGTELRKWEIDDKH